MTKYYFLKNKHTNLWDICTNNENNPPLEKHVWAGDFKTKEEAEKYLGDTLKKLKEENSTQQNQPMPTILIPKAYAKAYTKVAYRNAGSRQILYGFLLMVIGIVITFVSYALAPPGGIYIVAGGAIIVGIYYVFKGIYYHIKAVATR